MVLPDLAEELLDSEASVKGRADPWHRLCSSLTQPILTVIEFCQVEGPRPLVTLPAGAAAAAHIDLDAVAVWLMSSETASGTILIVYNQQMAVHALSYHTTIYDIRARAFQRPVCVSLLCGRKPTGELLSRFASAVRRLLKPLVLCNRRLFLAQLSEMITLSNALEADTVQEYYAISRDELRSPTFETKVHAVAEHARRLGPRMQCMYESLSTSTAGATAVTADECAGHEPSKNVLVGGECASGSVLADTFHPGKPLLPLCALAPCAYDSFISGLEPLLSHLGEATANRGVLYSADRPVLRFPKFETPSKHAAVRRKESVPKDEESLKTVAAHLDQLLYPILCGDRLAVVGAQQRKHTVMDLVHKLDLCRPRAHSQQPTSLWSDDESFESPSGSGVWGRCGSRASSAKACDYAVLDANACVLRTWDEYRGELLKAVASRGRFPSDAALLSHISAQMAALCSLVYVSRYVPLSRLPTDESISPADMRILANLLCEVDFVRFNRLKDEIERRTKKREKQVKTIQL